MSRDNDGLARGLFIGFLIGGIAGAVAALLYAPKSGKELRSDIRKKTDELSDEMTGYLRSAQSKTTEMINKGKDLSDEVVANAREKAGHLMDDAEKVLTDIRSRAASEQGRVKSAIQAGVDTYRSEKGRKS